MQVWSVGPTCPQWEKDPAPGDTLPLELFHLSSLLQPGLVPQPVLDFGGD